MWQMQGFELRSVCIKNNPSFFYLRGRKEIALAAERPQCVGSVIKKRATGKVRSNNSNLVALNCSLPPQDSNSSTTKNISCNIKCWAVLTYAWSKINLVNSSQRDRWNLKVNALLQMYWLGWDTGGPQPLLHPGKTSCPHKCTAQEPKDQPTWECRETTTKWKRLK